MALATFGSTAFAQAPERTGFSIGAGLAIGDSPFVDADVEFMPLPLISYEGERFSLGVDGLSFTAFDTDAISLDLVARPRFSGIESADSDALDGLDRNITGDVGARIGYETGRFFASATLLQEFTGEHDGQELQIEAGTRLRAGPVPISLSAGIDWQSSDLAQYAWGVYADEATVGRPAYDPGDVVIPFVAAQAVYPLSQRVVLIGGVEAQFLPDAVTDSPIVEDDVTVSGFVGLSYAF